MHKIIVPQEMPNDDKFNIVKVYAQTGSYVLVGDPLFDLESSKAIFTIQAEKEGYFEVSVCVGVEVCVGDVIGFISDERPNPEEKRNIGAVALPEKTVFSKKAIDLMEEHKIDPAIFAEKYFVDSSDVIQKSSADFKSSSISSAKVAQINALSIANPVPITSTLHIEVKCKGLLRFTKKNHDIFKFSFTPLIINEAAKALKNYELLNAYFDKEAIVLFDSVNIGYAIDNGKGLKVVTIRKSDGMSLHETEQALSKAIEAYDSDLLTGFDLSGSTFSITDLSFEGISTFTPLINGRQSAILGIGCTNISGEFFSLSLTFDHRVADGRYAAKFLKEIKTAIENKLEE